MEPRSEQDLVDLIKQKYFALKNNYSSDPNKVNKKINTAMLFDEAVTEVYNTYGSKFGFMSVSELKSIVSKKKMTTAIVMPAKRKELFVDTLMQQIIENHLKVESYF